MGDEPAHLEDPEEDLNRRKPPFGQPDGEQIMEALEEERAAASTQPTENGFPSRGFKKVPVLDEASDNGSLNHVPGQVESPTGSVLSNPDDTPSVPVLPSLSLTSYSC